MANLDFLKENLSYLRLCFGIISASFLSLCAWLGTNYEKAEFFLFALAFFIACLFALVLAFLNFKIKKNIKALDEIKKD